MRTNGNWVVIKPEPNLEYLSGFRVTDDDHMRWSTYARVLAVPNKLRFIPNMPNMSHVNQRYSQLSLEVDTDMELSVGDRVIFRYNAHMDVKDGINAEEWTDEEYELMVPYDAIYAKEVEGGWYPLCGRIFVEEIEPGFGLVRFAGGVNRAYLTTPQITDDDSIQVGMKVRYSVVRGVKMISDYFEDDLSKLRRMYRREILLIDC